MKPRDTRPNKKRFLEESVGAGLVDAEIKAVHEVHVSARRGPLSGIPVYVRWFSS